MTRFIKYPLFLVIIQLISCSGSTEQGITEKNDSTEQSDPNQYTSMEKISYSYFDEYADFQLTLYGIDKLNDNETFEIRKIEIGEAGKEPFQVIEGLNSTAEYYETGNLAISVDDFNFDNREDFFIAVGGEDRAYWLFDDRQNKYVFHEELSKLGSVMFDSNKNELETRKYNAETGEMEASFFKFDGNELVNFKTSETVTYTNGFKRRAINEKKGNNWIRKTFLFKDELIEEGEEFFKYEDKQTLIDFGSDFGNLIALREYSVNNETTLALPHSSCNTGPVSLSFYFYPEEFEGSELIDEFQYPVIIEDNPDAIEIYEIDEFILHPDNGLTLKIQKTLRLPYGGGEVENIEGEIEELYCYFDEDNRILYIPFGSVFVAEDVLDHIPKSEEICNE